MNQLLQKQIILAVNDHQVDDTVLDCRNNFLLILVSTCCLLVNSGRNVSDEVLKFMDNGTRQT